MDAVLYSRAQVNEEDAEARQLTLIAQFARRNPHFRQSAVAKQDRQSPGVWLVSLLGQRHSPLGLDRVAQFRAVA